MTRPCTLTQVCTAILLVLCCHTLGHCESSWPTWRGPNGNGTALDGRYPTAWNEKSGIRWKLPLEGRGASTPIELNGLLILTLGANEENVVLAVDRDGKIAWQQKVGKEKPGKHAKASGANSSAVTDGTRIFAYFKSGDLACLDDAGKVLWKTNIQSRYGEDSLWWDLGTSPIVTDQCVIITVMQTGPSFLVALDKQTGQEVWKADRWLDVREEANQSYTTPTMMQIDGVWVIVTLGADHVTAHGAENGKLLWKLGGFNPDNDGYFRSIASPVVAGDIVLCPYARGSTLTAVRSQVSLPDSERVAWRADFGSDVPTPTVYEGRAYLLSDKGVVTCMDPKSGAILWKESLPKSNKAYSSSPLIAGDHMYCTREDSVTFVLGGIRGDAPKLVSQNDLDGFSVASPVAIDGRIYLRTYEALYCIE
ncbi:MAG: PQQ-binding-like beta-propeller repeat protein [Pirellula sp.]|nr:PQQ-binding-like beta-propeller repeat protein [Pirellula sp.]